MALHQSLREYAAYLVKKDSGGTKDQDGGVYYSQLKVLIEWACGESRIPAPAWIKRDKNLNITAHFYSKDQAQKFRDWIDCGTAVEEDNWRDGPYGIWKVDMFDLLKTLAPDKQDI